MLRSLVLPVALALAAGSFLSAVAAEPAGKMRCYFGTYTGAKSKGIYAAELDLATGKLGPVELVAEVASPSFLAIHPSGKHLYCVNEVSSVGAKKTGAVTAFAIDPKTGQLTKVNEQSSGGGGPCHLALDRAGKVVVSANYGGGSVCAHPVKADGSLGDMTGFIQHTGAGADPARQKAPHAHSINVDPTGKFALAADLGLDKVLIYKLDAAKGTLTPNDPPHGSLAPVAGPRHLTFDPTGKRVYVINEMANTVTAFNFDSDQGSLTELQTLSTLPADFSGKSYTAEVVMHPSGKFVYGSNRGHDSIAIFTVDQATGKLTAAGHQAGGIKTPRNFAIDPTGTILIVCNQASDSVLIYRINQQTGQLQQLGDAVPVPAPVCVRYLPISG